MRTVKPMDRDTIYILHTEQQNPVKLLPFIRLMTSPKTQANTIYFYSKMLGDKVSWVSYHYDKDSDIKKRTDNAVTSAIKLLQAPIGDLEE